MVIVWFAAGAILLIAGIWASSVMVMKTKGGALPVDNDRDIDDRYFAKVLRNLLRPALAPDWGTPGSDGWFTGSLTMHRKAEMVALYRGSLCLEQVPFKVAALVVTGDLVIADGARVECDIWSLGEVTVGKGCTLRALAADGSVAIGERTVVSRWVDAGRSLLLKAGATVVTTASAGEDLLLENGFRGGKLAAPVVRILAVADSEAQAAARERVAEYQALRERYGEPAAVTSLQSDSPWITPRSVRSEGRLWIGPGTVILHDLIIRNSLVVGEECVIAGNVHVEGDCSMAPGAIVTGNLACSRLTMESGAVVGGSVHVDGDAIVRAGAMVGLLPGAGGLAVTGQVQLGEQVSMTGRVSAVEILQTGLGRRKAG